MENKSLILSFVICLNFLLASCNVLSTYDREDDNTLKSTVPSSINSSNRRNSYKEIDLNQLPAHVLKKGEHPRKLALNAFGLEEIEESLQEDVEMDTNNSKQAVVTITQTNLPDDSVKSIRYRIDFKSDQSQWQMEWAGKQFVCQQGRGSQDWSKELCY